MGHPRTDTTFPQALSASPASGVGSDLRHSLCLVQPYSTIPWWAQARAYSRRAAQGHLSPWVQVHRVLSHRATKGSGSTKGWQRVNTESLFSSWHCSHRPCRNKRHLGERSSMWPQLFTACTQCSLKKACQDLHTGTVPAPSRCLSTVTKLNSPSVKGKLLDLSYVNCTETEIALNPGNAESRPLDCSGGQCPLKGKSRKGENSGKNAELGIHVEFRRRTCDLGARRADQLLFYTDLVTSAP